MKKTLLFSILLTACQTHTTPSQDALSSPLRKYPYRVELIAGSSEPGFKDGVGQEARFDNKDNGIHLAVDTTGVIYLANQKNNSIRKIDTDKRVTTLINNRQQSEDGIFPSGISLDTKDNLYIRDQQKNCWLQGTERPLKAFYCSQNLSGTLLFKDDQAFLDNPPYFYKINQDSTLTQAKEFGEPDRTNSQGEYFHTSANVIKTTPTSQLPLTTPIGKDTKVDGKKSVSPDSFGDDVCPGYPPNETIEPPGGCEIDNVVPVRGYVDGPKEIAEFNKPGDLVVGKDDTVYVFDTGNSVMRTIAADTLEVGTLPLEFKTSIGQMALDPQGNIVAVSGNRIVRIDIPKK